MTGSAILTAEPINGVRNAAIDATISADVLRPLF